jgi:hypothetical protein
MAHTIRFQKLFLLTDGESFGRWQHRRFLEGNHEPQEPQDMEDMKYTVTSEVFTAVTMKNAIF